MTSTTGPDPPIGTEAASMNSLPPEVLMTILLHVDSAADIKSFSGTCQGMHSLLDPHFTAQWLLKYQPQKAMWLAAEKMRSTDTMLQLLRLGASPTASYRVYYKPFTPLELAACYGHSRVVQVLLQNRDVQASVSDAVGALYYAIEGRNVECLKALLVPHSPVHANSRGSPGYGSKFSPLHAAASIQYCDMEKAFQIAKILLEHGGVCTARDSDGKAPLHNASASGCAMVVHLLLYDAPEGLSMLCYRDHAGHTPLHKACGCGTTWYSSAVVHHLLNALGALSALTVRDNQGRTPLHVACIRQAPSWLINSLLLTQEGLTALSIPDNAGHTPLHCACGIASPRVVGVLLNAPGDVAVRIAAHDQEGQTPLHRVCGSKGCAPSDQVDVVHLLLDASGGLDVIDAADNRSRTPLRLAAENAVQCCEVLLHAGSKAVHISDSMGLTPVDVSFGAAKRLMLRWK